MLSNRRQQTGARFARARGAVTACATAVAEIVLFTMVGAQVNIAVALKAGLAGALVIAVGLAVRSIGTWL